MMKIKKHKSASIAIETAQKHNNLAEIMRNQFNQVEGVSQAHQKVLEQANNRIFNLERDVKLLSFHLTKARFESKALRTCLTNNIPMDQYQIVFDNFLRNEFLVDSNNVPIGSCQVTEYN